MSRRRRTRQDHDPPGPSRTSPWASRSWEPVADWYACWAGPRGSRHHRDMAIPALLDLLQPAAGDRVLDIGCGAGALAAAILEAGAGYVGVDLSRKLVAIGRRHYRGRARLLHGDATDLPAVPGLRGAMFDAATFLFSIQDINPLDDALRSAAWAVRPGGRLVAVMTHPCFRVPRQSGWGWDEGRRLRYRRIDRYLSPLDVPMQRYRGGRRGHTRSYHRPLEAYVEALGGSGFVIDALRELPAAVLDGAPREDKADRTARQEIPFFMVLRALRR